MTSPIVDGLLGGLFVGLATGVGTLAVWFGGEQVLHLQPQGLVRPAGVADEALALAPGPLERLVEDLPC